MNIKVAALGIITVLAIAGVGVVFVTTDDGNSGFDVIIACGSKTCYEPFWIAEEYGFFEEEGVKVKMEMVDGGGSATTALLNGSVDLTLVGADPAIRLFNSGKGGYAIATIESAKASGTDFAYRTDYGIDLSDASSFLNPDKSVKVHCGLDTTTAYYSGYLAYLYEQVKSGIITDEEYQILRTKKTPEKDGGIVHVPFDNQAVAIINNDVQMICSGNTVELASKTDSIETGSSPFNTVIGGCVIIVSDEAYNQKTEDLVKVLRALDKACRMIEDTETVDEVSEFCANWYSSGKWSAEEQKNFFASYYWDICNMISMADYLEYMAELLDYKNPDYDDLVKTDLVVKAHEGVTVYDGLYTYDNVNGVLIEA